MADETTKKVKTELDLDIEGFSKNAEKAAEKAEDIEKSVEGATQEVDKLGKTTEKQGKKMENALNKIIPKFLGFAAVTSVLRTSWKSIIEEEQAIAQMNYTLGESAKIVKDFSVEFSSFAGISETKVIQLSSALSQMLQNLLSDTDAIANLSTEMVRMIDRISGATGQEEEKIMNRFKSLIRGNLQAFQDWGINTRKEVLMTTDTWKKLAGDRSWNELTRNERTQIAIIETMIQLNEKFDHDTTALSDDVGDLTSRWENLTSAIGVMMTQVGKPVLGFLTTFTQMTTDAFKALNSLGDGWSVAIIGGIAFLALAPKIVLGLKSIFTSTMSATAGFLMLGSSVLMFTLLAASLANRMKEQSEALEDIGKSGQDAAEGLEDAEEATENLEEAQKGLMGIDEINTLSGGKSGSNLLEDEFSSDKYNQWVEEWLASQEQIRGDADETIAKIGEMTDSFSSWMIAIATAQGLLALLGIAIKLVTYEKTKQAAATAANTDAEIADTAATTENTIAETANTTETDANVTATKAETTATKAETAATTSETDATAANTVTEAANTKTTQASTSANWLHNASLATKIGLVTLGIGAIAIVGGAIALGVMMSQQGKSNKMARGGVVNQATQATIGEGVYHEAVIPLGNSPEWNDTKEDLAAYLSENGGGGATRVDTVVNLNGREIAKATSEDIHDDWKRRGWI